MSAAPSGHRRGPVDVRGLTAVVTGAGSGIGRSLALLLAARGAEVHLADRDGESAEAVAATARAGGGTATAHTVDVTDAAAVSGLADTVQSAGPVDLLFNNAGIGHAGPTAETPLEDWRRVLDVNLMGVVHGVHAFLPRLLTQGRPAHVVNTASVAGLVPIPGLAPYSTSKAAVVGLSEALALELRGSGVHVYALCPGVIDTAITARSTMRGAYEQRRQRAVDLYAHRGTSPDVVARHALAALGRDRVVIPTPRYQVVPHWLLKRASPRASAVVSRLTARVITG